MIKTLYTNGCSWCQGYLLHEDPVVRSHAESIGYEFLDVWEAKLHGEFIMIDDFRSIYDEFNWAGLLQKKFNIPNLVNHGEGAGSNARILRTTLDYVKSLSAEQRTETLVVIGWTLPDRGELYLDDGSGIQRWELFNASMPWDTLTPPDRYNTEFYQRMTDYWRRYVADVHSTYASVKLFFQQSYLLANTLENLGIRYYFFNSFPVFWGISDNEERLTFNADVEHYQQHCVMPVSDTFTDLVIPRPDLQLSDGHPNSQGYKLWADTLHTAITQRGLV